MVKYVLISIFCFSAIFCTGDNGLEMLTISNGKNFYYLSTSTGWGLKDNDLCYYDSEGNYVEDVAFQFYRLLGKCETINVYKTRFELKIGNVEKSTEGIFRYYYEEAVQIPRDDLIDYYLVDAIIGTDITYSFSTPRLTEGDKEWMEQSNIELLFILSSPNCDYSFLGIKNNWSKKEIRELYLDLSKLYMMENQEKFYEKITALHKEFIVMFGNCYC